MTMRREEKQGGGIRGEAWGALLIVLAGAGLIGAGYAWVLALAGAVALVLAVALWVLIPSHRVPRNRVRYMRIRLRLRLHPGQGFASAPGLWLRWGRLAAWRHSGRIRGLMPAWYRLAHPDSHSVRLGRAHYRHGLRSSMDSHVVVLSPPRKGKSGWLARVINHYPGPVVSTTTKPDVFRLTSGLRSLVGPVHVFNPQGIGGLPSTFHWDPLAGCQDPTVAIRRADAFAGAISTKGVEGGDFWRGKASDMLRAMFAAAALGGLSMQDVSDWVLTGDTRYPETVLAESGYPKWAAQLAELRSEASKTSATVRMTMSRALAFLTDPRLAASVMPGAGFGLDIREFIEARGTLYMLAMQQGEDAPLAPLFACLASEIHFQAAMLASGYPEGHLDPPLGMFLDEVTQICPVPVPTWAADSGGKGIQLFIVAHGRAQLAERWGEHGARVIFDTAGVQVFLPGITDPDTLDLAQKLSGTFAGREHGSEHVHRLPVMDAAMVRELPDRFALILRDNLRPVVARMPMAWRDPAYKRARRRNRAIAAVMPAAVPEPLPLVPLPPVPTADHPLAPVPSMNGRGEDDAEAFPWAGRR
jgi:type IV secretion system protein VirD4